MWGTHWGGWFSSDGHILSPNSVDIATAAQGVGGWLIKGNGGGEATWETEKRRNKLLCPWAALLVVFFSPSRGSLVGCVSLLQRWASFPPSPPGKLVPKSYPFELQWEAAFLWGHETGIFERLSEVPGHAFFTWCDVKPTFVWWFHTLIQAGILGRGRKGEGGKVNVAASQLSVCR